MSLAGITSNLTRSIDISKVSILLVDLDETVYPSSSSVWPLVRERLDIYLRDRLGFDPLIIPELRERLFNTYGTTLRGLQVEYSVDTDDYLEFVHDIQVEKYMETDEELIKALERFPQPKYIFTNASRGHAQRVMQALGIDSQFERIIDVQDFAPFCKPQLETFHIAMQIIGEPNPVKYLFIDDAPRNLLAGRSLGMQVLQVGGQNEIDLPAIAKLADIGNLQPG
jgi:putative hydrolase of the HAD superfamily